MCAPYISLCTPRRPCDPSPNCTMHYDSSPNCDTVPFFFFGLHQRQTSGNGISKTCSGISQSTAVMLQLTFGGTMKENRTTLPFTTVSLFYFRKPCSGVYFLYRLPDTKLSRFRIDFFLRLLQSAFLLARMCSVYRLCGLLMISVFC